jgi:hypothetical protein
VSEAPYSTREYEGVTLRSENLVPLRNATLSASDESILIGLLNDWGPEPTGRLLDYVYFQTEPMQAATRNEKLNFSSVTIGQPEKYKRSSSNTSPSDLARKKREFHAKVAARNLHHGSNTKRQNHSASL